MPKGLYLLVYMYYRIMIDTGLWKEGVGPKWYYIQRPNISEYAPENPAENWKLFCFQGKLYITVNNYLVYSNCLIIKHL